jgi:hypothetical protein
VNYLNNTIDSAERAVTTREYVRII